MVFLHFQTVCTQSAFYINDLHGRWINADDLDCPDVLDFSSNGTYKIFNDCGIIDPEQSAVEKGSWKFKSKEKEIILFNREFVTTNSVFSGFHGKEDSLSFKIKELNNNKLTVCFTNDNNCMVENYVRLP